MRGLPVIEPIWKGALLGIWSVLLASIGLAFFLGAVPNGSAELLRSLAIVGAILLPAYVVEVVWLLPRMGQGIEHEEWLGFLAGAALATLLGVSAALLLAEHRSAGHANAIDDFGLAWVIASQLILGGALVLQPLLAHRFGGGAEG